MTTQPAAQPVQHPDIADDPVDLKHEPDVLTVADIARVLRIGRNAAYRLVASGAIRSVRVGVAIRIPRSSLLRYLDGGQEP
jgi:excisionase family DNA binding protein